MAETLVSPATTLAYGATLLDGEVAFRVWAPNAKRVTLRLVGEGDHTMQRSADGAFAAMLPARVGDRYLYRVDDGQPVPDPVSRLLPEGVHGPTEIVDPNSFVWTDRNWGGVALRDAIIYELHVGTFTPAGTLDAAIERLPYLRELGVTLIELMPVAAFPGTRNWGYDGVSPYSVQNSYGGPDALKRFVNAAHAHSLGVMLDVVYNHLGHEGNYLRQFGPYFTSRHHTPWGEAINFDGPGSAGVRRFFIDNALYWIREYHLDGLRLDAVQTIYDESPQHILAEIEQNVQALARELGRQVLVIAESDANDPALVRQAPSGYGLDAVWSDDFHHALHALLTGERHGYYQDFGALTQLARSLEAGFVFQGEHFKFWGKPRGASPAGIPLERHVICTQNHDQVGNRARGERMSALVSAAAQKLAAALLLLAPETPLLFMGQEYGEAAPFQYFTDYSDPELARAVSEGRRREFPEFSREQVPDPQDPATLARSRLNWETATRDNELLGWYRALIALRKRSITGTTRTCRAEVDDSRLTLSSPAEKPAVVVLADFAGAALATIPTGWNLAMDSADENYAVRVLAR